MRQNRPFVTVAVLSLIIVFSWAAADDSGNSEEKEVNSQESGRPTGSSQDNSQKARDLVGRFTKNLWEAAGFSVGIRAIQEQRSETWLEGSQQQFVLRVQRPDRISFINKDAGHGAELIYDGQKCLLFSPLYQKYELFMAQNIEALWGRRSVARVFGQVPFVEWFLSSHLWPKFEPQTSNWNYLGKEDMDQVSCEHIFFTWQDIDWHLWLEVGDTVFLRQLKPDLSRALAKARSAQPEKKISDTMLLWRFDSWQRDPVFADDTFAVKIPQGGQRTTQNPLEGQKALDINLPLLEGGSFELASHQGKNIVILDFWATWCGPCRKAMPVINKVAKAFADRQVVLYTINSSDTEDKIRHYLKGAGLNVNVALDIERKAAGLYQVQSIPFTVIIGRNGIIQNVHVGMGPDAEAELTGELEMLLSGQEMAANAPPVPIHVACRDLVFVPQPAVVGQKVGFSCKVVNQGDEPVGAGAAVIQLTINDTMQRMAPIREPIPAGGAVSYQVRPEQWYFEPLKVGNLNYKLVVGPAGSANPTSNEDNHLKGVLTVTAP